MIGFANNIGGGHNTSINCKVAVAVDVNRLAVFPEYGLGNIVHDELKHLGNAQFWLFGGLVAGQAQA